jgi:acetoin utilization deacetylase AcuC-like enzyme
MRVTTEGFGLFAKRLCAVADEACGGRIALALEGGYDLDALAASVGEVVRVLAEPSPARGEFPAASHGGMEMARTFRAAHARYWPSLAGRIYG